MAIESRDILISRRLLSASGWASFAQILGLASGLVANALLARLLSAEEMGAYFITTSFIGLFSVIAQIGLAQASVRLMVETVGKGGNARKLAGSVYCYGALASVLVVGLLLAGIGDWFARYLFNSPVISGLMVIIAALVVIAAFQDITAEMFRGLHDVRLASLFKGLATSLISAGMFGMLWLLQGHADLRQVLMCAVVAGLTSTLMSAFVLQRKLPRQLGSNVVSAPWGILRAAWPLSLSNLAMFVTLQADLWIVAHYCAEVDIAMYGGAMRLVFLVTFSNTIVVLVMQSTIAELYQQGELVRLEGLLRKAARIAWIAGAAVTLVYMLWGDVLMALVFGGPYQNGGVLLMGLAITKLLSMTVGPTGAVLMMSNREGGLLMLTVLGSLLSAGFAMLLVEEHGAIGVIVGWGAGNLIQTMLSWYVVRQQVGIDCLIWNPRRK